MLNEIAMYFLSAIILGIGCVSLLKQKVSATNEKGEEISVEVPFFGKLQTNFPAAAFVFIGAALAAFTFDKSCQLTDDWTISGEFKPPDESMRIDWDCGVITLLPPKLISSLKPNGEFEIIGSIRKGIKFEDVVQQISYCNWCGDNFFDAKILTRDEHEKYMKNVDSRLKTVESNMRIYKPIIVKSTQR
jgi:hypothetical protein